MQVDGVMLSNDHNVSNPSLLFTIFKFMAIAIILIVVVLHGKSLLTSFYIFFECMLTDLISGIVKYSDRKELIHVNLFEYRSGKRPIVLQIQQPIC
jgi:hypothetical protein